MEVILNESIPSLGFVGDMIRVKSGYARNYLLPRGLAVEANKKNARELAHRKRILDVKRSKLLGEAKGIAAKLEALTVTLAKPVHEGKLYGSVTTIDIADALAGDGVTIDRKLITLAAPIKAVGDYEAAVKLHPDVIATLKIHVKKPE